MLIAAKKRNNPAAALRKKAACRVLVNELLAMTEHSSVPTYDHNISTLLAALHDVHFLQ